MKYFFTLFLLSAVLTVTNAQEYKVVADKSAVKFTIKNLGFNTGGSFSAPEGTIVFDPANLSNSQFDVSIDASTVNTDNSTRDGHLKKEEYFDVEKHPRITFKSEKITGKGSSYSVTGKLTIKATSKTITFPFTAQSKEGGYLFEGSFQVNRRDYQVGGNSVVLSDNATVNLSIFGQKK